jgi:hypothetical protein
MNYVMKENKNMDLDDQELKATNPNVLEKENKLLKEKIKQLELEVQFYKEIYYGYDKD